MSPRWMEAVMRTSFTQLVLMAAAVVALSTSAAAESPVEQTYPASQDVLVNRHDAVHSETGFRLEEHQSLRGYFLDVERSRFKGR
jgi:hypothetical protein